MRHRVLRHIAAIVLLATYLPMVVLSSLHVHHETADSNDNCLQCAGHIESAHHHENDCQYCHFLSLSYVGENIEQSTVILPATDRRSAEIVDRAELLRYGVALLRAPPIV